MWHAILTRFRLLSVAERRIWSVTAALGLLAVILEMATGGVVYALIAFLTNPENAQSRPLLAPVLARLPSGASTSRTMALLLLAGLVHVLRTLFQLGIGHAQTVLSSRATFALSTRLYSLYMRAPYSLHLSRGFAQLETHVAHTSTYTLWVLNGAVSLFTQTMTVLGLSYMVAYVAPWPTILTALAVFLMLWLFLRQTKGLYAQASLKLNELGIKAHALVNHGLGGFKELRVLGRDEFFAQGYETSKLAALAITQRHHLVSSLPRFLIEALFGAGILLAAAASSAAGQAQIAPLLGLFAYVGIRAIPSTIIIANELGAIRNHIALSDPIILDLKALGERPARGSLAERRFRNTLHVRDVTFRYESAPDNTLESIDLVVQQKRMLGVVGRSGAGKTTLGDLILGLHLPTRGELLVDGHAWSPDQERLRAGYVPQAPYLIDDSIRTNVALGLAPEAIDDARVWRALALARLDTFVRNLSAGLDTTVGERGARLSGGERQRIAIARALYVEPDILVLDEATSALDPATEREIVETLAGLKEQMAIVVISHRLSTISACDEVLVLRHGRIDGCGSVEELRRTSRSFRDWAGLSETTE